MRVPQSTYMVVADGYVGSDSPSRIRARLNGDDARQGFKKVTIPRSSAIVAGLVEGTIERTQDPDFGYQVAAAIPGMDATEILPPERL